jgi:hypothetical protein
MPSLPLKALLAEDTPTPLAGLAVSGITADSRAVAAGTLFFALKGEKTDGMAYASAAAAAGAAAIVTDRADAPAEIAGVPVVTVANARLSLALAASRFHARQPAPSPRSPAPPARPPSPPSCARSSRRRGMPPPPSARSAWCAPPARSMAA